MHGGVDRQTGNVNSSHTLEPYEIPHYLNCPLYLVTEYARCGKDEYPRPYG
jgi:hypothetical protein